MIYVILFLVLYVLANKKLIRFIKNECKKIININIQHVYDTKPLMRIISIFNKLQ